MDKRVDDFLYVLPQMSRPRGRLREKFNRNRPLALIFIVQAAIEKEANYLG